MRPYQNGKTPKTPGTGKRQHSRRGKSSAEMNGVKRTLVKAKVTAVKATRKITNRNNGEVDNLLEKSISTPAPIAKPKGTPKSSTKTVSKMQQKLRKSFADLKNLEKKATKKAQESVDETEGKPPTNGNRHVDVELAQEAVEVRSGSGAGFLKRAVSKLWKAPIEGINGVPYTDINSPPPTPTVVPREPARVVNGKDVPVPEVPEAKSSCVIS